MVDFSSKELVRNLFQQRVLPRMPFIPWVSSFAAQLEQLTVEEMLCDPGLLSSSLINAQKLFGYDGIAVVFDPSLEAEACGCEIEWLEGALPKVTSHPLSEGASLESLSLQDIEKRGRIPTVLDALKRTIIVGARQTAILGIVTGPFALAGHLMGDRLQVDLEKGSQEAENAVSAAASIGLKLAKKYCEAGVDAIVVADGILGQGNANAYRVISGPLKSLWNVTRFYGVHSVLLTTASREENLDPIFDLQAEGVAPGGDVSVDRLAEEAQKRNTCCGISVKLEDRGAEARFSKRNGVFLTTDWEVPFDTDVSVMHAVMAAIGGTH